MLQQPLTDTLWRTVTATVLLLLQPCCKLVLVEFTLLMCHLIERLLLACLGKQLH
jgi:hypothetical protein